MFKFWGIILIISTISFPQGGKLSFPHEKICRFDKSSYKDTLKLLELSGNHGLKALQFRLTFNEGSLLEFENLSKGKSIDSPEWSLQYNVKSNLDNPSRTIVYVLLYNLSTGELPPGTYNNFICYEYRVNDLLGLDNQKSTIEMSDVKGSWFDGTDAKISGDSSITIFITARKENKTLSELYQNYPNPFNPGTVISYYLPEENFIKLKIFNSIGKEITTLIEGFQKEGLHSVNYEISAGQPSGVYFCILEGKEFTLSKKILFLK